jgi:hypothetical protein
MQFILMTSCEHMGVLQRALMPANRSHSRVCLATWSQRFCAGAKWAHIFRYPELQ